MENKNTVNIGLIVLMVCSTLIIGLLGGYALFNYIQDNKEIENTEISNGDENNVDDDETQDDKQNENIVNNGPLVEKEFPWSEAKK